MRKKLVKVNLGNDHEYIAGRIKSGKWKILYVRKVLTGFPPEKWNMYWQDSIKYPTLKKFMEDNYVSYDKLSRVTQQELDEIFFDLL